MNKAALIRAWSAATCATTYSHGQSYVAPLRFADAEKALAGFALGFLPRAQAVGRRRGVDGQVMAAAINPAVGEKAFQSALVIMSPVRAGPLVGQAALAAPEKASLGDADFAAHGLHFGGQARVQRGHEVGDDEFHCWYLFW